MDVATVVVLDSRRGREEAQEGHVVSDEARPRLSERACELKLMPDAATCNRVNEQPWIGPKNVLTDAAYSYWRRQLHARNAGRDFELKNLQASLIPGLDVDLTGVGAGGAGIGGAVGKAGPLFRELAETLFKNFGKYFRVSSTAAEQAAQHASLELGRRADKLADQLLQQIELRQLDGASANAVKTGVRQALRQLTSAIKNAEHVSDDLIARATETAALEAREALLYGDSLVPISGDVVETATGIARKYATQAAEKLRAELNLNLGIAAGEPVASTRGPASASHLNEPARVPQNHVSQALDHVAESERPGAAKAATLIQPTRAAQMKMLEQVAAALARLRPGFFERVAIDNPLTGEFGDHVYAAVVRGHRIILAGRLQTPGQLCVRVTAPRAANADVVNEANPSIAAANAEQLAQIIHDLLTML